MSGYRQSSYDPEAYQQMGKPLRPFNWVQWAGVVLAVIGIAIDLVYYAGRFGWIASVIDRSSAATPLLLAGIVLIHSRREPDRDVTPDQRAANRRLLIIIAAICALILGLAAALDLLGA